jgi:cyclase
MLALFRAVASSLLVLVLLPALVAAEDHFIVTTLAPDLLMLSTDQGSYSNNSLVFTGEEGVLLVDTHHDSDAEALRDFVENLGLGVPKYIVNTHRHLEHIGGNAVFGPDPIIVAHRLLPEKLLSGAFLFSEYPRESFPDITFEDSVDIRFNGEIIRLTHIGGSHDDNEIMVHFTTASISRPSIATEMHSSSRRSPGG